SKINAGCYEEGMPLCLMCKAAVRLKEPAVIGDIDMHMTELPYNMPGKVYRCPMPFSDRDPKQSMFDEFKEKSITAVVLLVGDDECIRETGKDLRFFYQEQGIEVIHLPFDEGVQPELNPTIHANHINAAIDRVLELAGSGSNVAIHCFAGILRTGFFVNALSSRIERIG
ncbi:MAG: hypothetical protein PHT33_14635, partial [bacterium]|nr:hypothetical protein [bacterium]